MPDKVRPLKIESASTGGTENDAWQTETNPDQDYLACAGIALKGSNNFLLDLDGNSEIQFKDQVSGQHPLKTLKLFDLVFGDNANPFVRENGTTFRVVSRFIFLGTDRVAKPSEIKTVLFGGGANTVPEMRLYDITNAQIIGVITGAVGTTPTIYTTSGSNWPSGEALFEVQLRRVSGSSEARISALSLLW